MSEIEHAVRIKANLSHVRAKFHGHVIADTNHALTVLETGCEPVQYFPRDDVDMAYMGKTQRRTRCPYKGEASYFTLDMDGEIAEDAVWSYENPIRNALALKGYIAFYPDKVEVYELTHGHDATELRTAHPY